jgi:hypothetical protein
MINLLTPLRYLHIHTGTARHWHIHNWHTHNPGIHTWHTHNPGTHKTLAGQWCAGSSVVVGHGEPVGADSEAGALPDASAQCMFVAGVLCAGRDALA